MFRLVISATAALFVAHAAMTREASTPAKEAPAQAETLKPLPVPDATVLRSIFDEALKYLAKEKAGNEAGENRKEQRESADLDAQKSMADSAQRMLNLTIWQIVVGGFGLLGLGWTVYYTRQTANAAKDAIALATDTAKHQLRAYVAIWGGSIEPRENAEPPHVAIHVELQNSGQTPGYTFRSWLHAVISEPDTDPFFSVPDLSDRPFSIIGPGIHTNLHQSVIATKEEIADLYTRKKRLYLWGRVEYQDAFGNAQFLSFHAINGSWYSHQNRWDFGPHKKGYQAS